jgi:hypothetical protein
MRKYLLQFEGRPCLVNRVVLAFCLATALFAPSVAFAHTTQATVTSRQHARRRHSSVHRNRHRTAVSRRHHSARSVSVHRNRTARSAGSNRRDELRRVSFTRRRRMRSHRRSRTYARAERISETLDQVHAQTTPLVEASAPLVEPLPTLITSSPDKENASGIQSTRNMPLFDISVPRYMPVPLRGSREVLIHQNIIADVEGLSRIQDDAQLNTMVRSGDLVALPASPALEIDPRLPLNRRYCRPWTAIFLRNLARAHQDIFGRPLQLTSAVRTVSFQRHLAHYNGNAAPTSGDTASPHLTGEAIDLGKKGMSLKEIAWMRAVLGKLQASGKLDVEEEFEQACFHISVYKTYTPHSAPPAQLVASDDASSPETNASNGAAIGILAKPVSLPVKHSVRSQRTHSYYVHHVRRVSVRRHHRHRSMSLLAAGLR